MRDPWYSLDIGNDQIRFIKFVILFQTEWDL